MSHDTQEETKVDQKKSDYSDVEQMLLKFETRLKGLESAYKRPVSDRTSFESRVFQKSIHSHNHAMENFIRSGEEYGQKSLTTSDSRTSGILIPGPTQDFVKQTTGDYSPIRKIARITTVTTDSLELLLECGGSDVGWVSETSPREETKEPSLTKVTIPTFEMYAKPRASQRVLDDLSINVEEWLVQKIAWQMGVKETEAFIHGDGKGRPRGFLSYEGVPLGHPTWGKIECLKTDNEGGISESDILLDVFYSLKPEYLDEACWIMSRATLALIRKLKDKDGQYLWLPHSLKEGGSTLLGYPVIVCDTMPMPEKGKSGIVFGNFKQAYQIVERQDMHVLRDPYSAKPYVEFYATKRVGGDVINFDALRLIQFA